MENLVFKWKVHSGGMFSEKVNTFHAFTEFTKISVPFVQNQLGYFQENGNAQDGGFKG